MPTKKEADALHEFAFGKPKKKTVIKKSTAKKKTVASEISSSKKYETKKMGRPTDYTEELADSLLHDIATSADGIKKICERHGILVSTFYLWVFKHRNFSERYSEAKEAQMKVLIEESREIADNESSDILEDGRMNSVKIQRDKLRLETRKWMIERLAPIKKEEDKTQAALQNMLDEAMKKAIKSKERDY